jgi:hypothetical protein
MSQGVGALDAFAVTRATLAYNQNQDRISLTCALKNEERVVLWLTARLATQLVPHLRQAVTQVPDTHSTNGHPTVTDHDAPTSAEALDRDKTPIAGSAQERHPEAPVVARADSATWVVTAIDLTNGPMLVQLGFRDDQGHAPVLLSLEHTQLAEWSEGLKRCYMQAGWSMDCWHMPTDTGPQSHATRRVALH